jgi:hypothetical protein
MTVFNLLLEPIWVFDIEKKSVWWANQAALDLWNADSLESLLNRNFAEDMSEVAAQRLGDYLERFHNGERVHEQVCIDMVLEEFQKGASLETCSYLYSFIFPRFSGQFIH